MSCLAANSLVVSSGDRRCLTSHLVKCLLNWQKVCRSFRFPVTSARMGGHLFLTTMPRALVGHMVDGGYSLSRGECPAGASSSGSSGRSWSVVLQMLVMNSFKPISLNSEIGVLQLVGGTATRGMYKVGEASMCGLLGKLTIPRNS